MRLLVPLVLVLFVLGCGKDATTVEEKVDYGRPVTSSYQLVYFRLEEDHDHSYQGEQTYPAWQVYESPVSGSGPLHLEWNGDSVHMREDASQGFSRKVVQEQGGVDTSTTYGEWCLTQRCNWDIRGTVSRGASFRFLSAHWFSPDPHPIVEDIQQPSGDFAVWLLNGTYEIRGDTLDWRWVRKAWTDPNPPWAQLYTAKYIRR